VKKLLPLFLMIGLIAPFVLTFSTLKVEKHHLKTSIKHRIIAGIDKSELVLLSFSKKEAEEKLEWEHSKEFEFKGEMYEVVETKETTDSISYWCWWDYEETQLNRQLTGLLLNCWQQNDSQKQQNNRLIQYTKNWFSNHLAPSCPTDQTNKKASNLIPYQRIYNNFQLEIPTPPPRFS
jgi:hypothetical protein